MTTNDNEVQRTAHRLTTSDKKSGTTSDKEWQWVVISGELPFFRIREEPITKYPKEDSLNQIPWVESWTETVELTADLAKQTPKKKY